MPAVEVSHIVKSYADKVVVNDLSFSVNQGEIFGLIGPNGAGKTTTIRMMMDLITPDSGEVTILGEKLSEASKNKLGYLLGGLLLVARLLRTYLLMYGKRPGLRVIVRNLRSG